MVEKIAYYRLVSGCGHQPQGDCLLERLSKQKMSLAQMRAVRGFSWMSPPDGDNRCEVECWKGRGPCFDTAGSLKVEKVK